MKRITYGDPSVNRSPVPARNGADARAKTALLTANERLLKLRAAGNVEPSSIRLSAEIDRPSSWLAPLTKPTTTPSLAQQPKANPEETISLFPDMSLAILRQGHAAIARIWLLLRHCDTQGAGWFKIADARRRLTTKAEPLRVCGWRQLRNLLRAGQGIFWERDKKRIWLYSMARVAAALGVQRLQERSVSLPVSSLLGGIGTVRAHLYASFHSGRHRNGKSQPIARETLTKLSGVGRDSQRAYEQQTNLTAQSNFAVSQLACTQGKKIACWQIGQHVFTLCDKKGNYGKPGATYLAWQLPNSYAGVHSQQPRRQQRRINRQLTDLLNHGTTGNDESMIGRRYFNSGSELSKFNLEATPIYWQEKSKQTTQIQFWHALHK